MTETTSLGAAMAAGAAEGVKVWSLSPGNFYRNHYLDVIFTGLDILFYR